MTQSPWSVAVVGPGGVGGLVGAVLTRAGHPVVYVARPQTAAALTAGGLSVTSPQYGDFHVPAVAEHKLAAPVDLCVIATKATDLDAALDGVPAEALGAGLVLPLLNGVDHVAALRERFPAAQVLAGAIRVASARTAPGQIAHTTPFCKIEVAGDNTARERLDTLAGQLNAAGIETAVRDSEAAVLWDKLAFLAPLALLTTANGATTGEVRDKYRPDLEAVIGEVVAVAHAAGATADAGAVLALFDGAPPAMKSSMQRDVEAGRPAEVDAIGGAVLRAAAAHGVDVPVTTRLVEDLRERGV
ncbi:ketopantoate reductase family protein [Phytohabitans houttuyneae]|uniref:2-dehydropantoate 2-reductase n=1 Tax=Phytohabitans houttuyneae TaxID=1076126 RepID=A0A6V8KS89_9ACTN|nr:2-dehydropantoate 2-reductase [Phytohabitans houttuyneae]GFJ84657.1 2-dehydropantoate 2-reductase [Phytohabitans houttuyneae]